jgi:uncharacterized protein YecT (DUF1311 family)
MRKLLYGLFGFTITLATTLAYSYAIANPSNVYAPTESEIVAVLSMHSWISETEVRKLLACCGKNKLSRDFCSYHDTIAADLKFKKVILQKKLQLPACKSEIDAKIVLWEKIRDQGCENATKKYAGGSIRPMLQTMCIRIETRKMIKKLENINSCNQI